MKHRRTTIILFVIVGLVIAGILYFLFSSNFNSTSMTVYDFTVKDTKGNDVAMSEYKGKVLLIINTATQCGFTPQYKDLQDVYLKYKDQGFEVLDFPCNQFGSQAPGSNEEIASFCEMKYKTTFRTFGKIDVNGDNADPLFKYLKDNSSGFLGSAIKWNFTKFLIDKNGKVLERYAPVTNPSKIENDIKNALKAEIDI